MSAPGRAVWIAFEGGEAAGKSTQAALLAARLDAVLTREPGGTALGERIRALLLDPAAGDMDARTETLLMAADRAQHVAERVRPNLSRGRAIVSDRSAYSSLAYQGYGRGLPVEAVRVVCDWATAGFWPDLVILLDAPTAMTAARMGASRDRLEAAGDDFHDRVVAGFMALAAAEPERWVVVEGTGSVDEVASRVAAVYDDWAGVRG